MSADTQEQLLKAIQAGQDAVTDPEHKGVLTALWEKFSKAKKPEGAAHEAAESPEQESEEQDNGDEDETCDECGAMVGPKDKKCKKCGAQLEDEDPDTNDEDDDDEEMAKALGVLRARGYSLTDEDGNALGEPADAGGVMDAEDLVKAIGAAVSEALDARLEPLLKSIAPPPTQDAPPAAEDASQDVVALRKSLADKQAAQDALSAEVADLKKSLDGIVEARVNQILDMTPVPAGRPAQLGHTLMAKSLTLGTGDTAETITEDQFEEVMAKAIRHTDPTLIGTMRKRFGTPDFEQHRPQFEEMRKTVSGK